MRARVQASPPTGDRASLYSCSLYPGRWTHWLVTLV